MVELLVVFAICFLFWFVVYGLALILKVKKDVVHRVVAVIAVGIIASMVAERII